MTIVTKPDVTLENVTEVVTEPLGTEAEVTSHHETERAVEKRDADNHRHDSDPEYIAMFGEGMGDHMRRNEIACLYQIGDGRAPANTREDKALARWVEIDQRRYSARATGSPFQFTPAERALKTRLLKAGLIINKEQRKLVTARDQHKSALEGVVRSAKAAAAQGNADAVRWLEDYRLEQDRKKWQKRERALRKLPPKTLLAAAKDAMEAKGVKFSLEKLWRDFTEAFDAATPEKQQAFCTGKPAMLEAYLKSRGVSLDALKSR